MRADVGFDEGELGLGDYVADDDATGKGEGLDYGRDVGGVGGEFLDLGEVLEGSGRHGVCGGSDGGW